MALSEISVFVDDNAQNALVIRVPEAVVNSGMFGGGSCSCGIGISSTTTGLAESLPNWTLLDQHGNARNAQISQQIGGDGIVPRTGNQEFTWDRSQALYSISGAASSGGQAGTLPDAIIRFMPQDQLPTAAEKEADSNLDGNLTFPAFGASLIDLDTGWENQV